MTLQIKNLIPDFTNRPDSAKSPSSSADRWRPADFNAYEESLEVAITHAADLIARAKDHAERVRKARDGEGAPEAVHDVFAGWLTLSGRQGCGKTTLARAVYEELRRADPFAAGVWFAGTNEYRQESRRPTCRWMHFNTFIDQTLSGDYNYPEWLARDWVVVVDDIGANREIKNSTVTDLLYRLCNGRLGKITLFTTNMTQTEIAERFDPRVQSRLIRDGNVFHRITAGDYAMRKTY